MKGITPSNRDASIPSLEGPFIEGRYFRGDGEFEDVIDPSTNDSLCRIRSADVEQVDKAVSTARRLFDAGDWPGLPPAERGEALRQVAAAIRLRHEELTEIESMMTGKPITSAKREVLGAAKVYDFYAGAMDKFYGETIPMGGDNICLTFREPIGVVAQIVPWNFPFLAAAWKLGPAIAAGCTTVLKPAPNTPVTALLLGDILNDAGVPPGAVNIVPGGIDTGVALVKHQQIDKIAFTGSSETGARIMSSAAAGIKKVMLELGGKSPNIVFESADIARAATLAVPAVFGNAGQSCSARSRVLVHRSVHDRFVEAFSHAALAMRIGPPSDERTELGPLISQDHWARVKKYVDLGLQEGAKLVIGGDRPADFQGGNYFQPTIFSGVSNSMRIAKEEIFGPVAAVIAFDEEDEAVAIANDSEFGLNATVWTQDASQSLRVARRLKTGSVAVNTHPSGSTQALYAPFGGYKKSGIGRELGMDALKEYTETKTVMLHTG